MGRLNIVAASAALGDPGHVAAARSAISAERAKWTAVLDELGRRHTQSSANFIAFDSGRPHAELASRLREHDIAVGRSFAPYATWVRITVGLPAENSRAQQALRFALKH